MSRYQPTYSQQGDGPLLLFLHGLGGNHDAFAPQFADLSKDYRCVAWNAPGYGSSAALPVLTFEQLSDCVASLVAALGQDPHAVIGHSFGGMVAQSWVAAGGQCDKLVLAQTTARFGKPGSDWNREFLAARLQPLEQGLTPADFAPALIRNLFCDPQRTAAMAMAEATMAALPAAVYRQVVECLVTFDGSAALAEITQPTLCMAAQHDATAPPKAVQWMAQRLPAAHYHCLPDAGHLAYVESPALFNAALREFLEHG